jgi:hypothetical protein
MKKLSFISVSLVLSVVLAYFIQLLKWRIFPCLITPVLPDEYDPTTYFGWCPGYNAGISGISYDFWMVYLAGFVYCLVIVLLGGLLISKFKK